MRLLFCLWFPKACWASPGVAAWDQQLPHPFLPSLLEVSFTPDRFPGRFYSYLDGKNLAWVRQILGKTKQGLLIIVHFFIYFGYFLVSVLNNVYQRRAAKVNHRNEKLQMKEPAARHSWSHASKGFSRFRLGAHLAFFCKYACKESSWNKPASMHSNWQKAEAGLERLSSKRGD